MASQIGLNLVTLLSKSLTLVAEAAEGRAPGTEKLVALSFGDKLFRLLLVLYPNVHAFVNSFCEFLDIFHFLSILIVNLLNDLKRSM